MVSIPREVIRAYALENALKYKGKASQGAVLSGLFAEGLQKEEVKQVIPDIQSILKEVNNLPPIEQKDAFEALKDKVSKREVREGLPDLPNVTKGKVVMRFAPFPSGPLHIGNARGLVLNDEYVKRYGGKLLLVMDDTIGSEAKPIEPDAYELIEQGAKWLGVKYDKKVLYKSDRLQIYYDYAQEMLKKGYLYVCNCSREEISANKKKGVECSCRQFTPEEQHNRWKEMFEAEEGSMVVRLKTDMMDPDPAFRDRIMFRISERPHAKTGTKYRVYPLLDFSWAIDDHLLGVTHILRGMELMMETRVEKFIWDIFGWPHPEVVHHGHFAIQGIKISKSKGAAEVKSGTYSGWNDPRTWSLQSLRDRGVLPETLREFIKGMGLRKTSITVPIQVLYTINKKLVEESPRYFFVEKPTRMTIAGCPPLKASLPLHPNGTLGKRTYETDQEFWISTQDLEDLRDGYYRLMHLLNFKVDDMAKLHQRSFSFFSKDPDPKIKPTYLHWLPANANNHNVKILMPDGSLKEGLGEPELSKLNVGDIVQFERVGFARLHKKLDDHLEFWFAHQ